MNCFYYSQFLHLFRHVKKRSSIPNFVRITLALVICASFSLGSLKGQTIIGSGTPFDGFEDCNRGCTANDFPEVSEAFLSQDASGNTPLTESCEPGTPQAAYLCITFTNGTGSLRKGIYLEGTFNNGDDQSLIRHCDPIETSNQTITTCVPDPIAWTCGDELTITDVFFAWNSSGDNLCSSNECQDWPQSKCRIPGGTIIVKAPLVANFDYTAECIDGNTAQTVTFNSTTTGGTKPYSIDWQITGEGVFVTDMGASFTHTFDNSGDYEVVIKVMDSGGKYDEETSIIMVESCCPAAGTACDDGDPSTENDVEDGECNCAGTPCPVAGTACDDGDPSTENDVEDGECNCAGTPCPVAGTACDDGDPSTENDVEDGECNCAGTPCPAAGTRCDDGDPSTENDVEDGECNCAGTPCPAAGTRCDDGDPSTENDVEDGECNCAGTPCPAAGTRCDDGDPSTENDVEDGQCNCAGTPCPVAGTRCDDGDPSTENDVEDGQCNCAGTPGERVKCSDVQIVGGVEQIMVSGLTAAAEIVQVIGAGTGWQIITICEGDCDNPTIITDLPVGEYTVKVQLFGSDGSYCYTEKRNVFITGDTGCTDNDRDGICAAEDCDDNNNQLPATPGTACDDGDDRTFNDVIQADGCTCIGEPDGGSGASCEDVRAVGGARQITVSGLSADKEKVEIIGANTGWQVVSICDMDCSDPLLIDNLSAGLYTVKVFMYGINCYTEIRDVEVNDDGGSCTDADGDGFCAAEDCDDNNNQLPATPGTACDDADVNTVNDQIQADGCTCAGESDGGEGCDNLQIQPGDGTITVSGFGDAIPLIKVWAKDKGWTINTYCDDENCSDPFVILTGSGRFKVEVKLFSDHLWGAEICTKTEEEVSVSSSRSTPRLPAFDIFPNPAMDETFINLSDYFGKTINLRIYNQLGQNIFDQSIPDVNSRMERISTKDFENGLYFIQIATKGSQPITRKLMISRLY